MTRPRTTPGAAGALTAKPQAWQLPTLTIADGSLEALKWLALVLMTLDHVNRYLVQAPESALFSAGRVVMPIFAIVLAYNLARPGTLVRGVYPRAMTRLAIMAAVASGPFVALGGLLWGWWPLNIMATLLVATGAMYLFERGGYGRTLTAWVLLFFGGALVEYWWTALAIAMGTWSYSRRPNWPAVLLVAAGFAGLCLINQNGWALAALPLIALASRFDASVPRLRWAFYAYYPLHLAAIWAVRAMGLN